MVSLEVRNAFLAFSKEERYSCDNRDYKITARTIPTDVVSMPSSPIEFISFDVTLISRVR
jgi:hypothetical protein